MYCSSYLCRHIFHQPLLYLGAPVVHSLDHSSYRSRLLKASFSALNLPHPDWCSSQPISRAMSEPTYDAKSVTLMNSTGRLSEQRLRAINRFTSLSIVDTTLQVLAPLEALSTELFRLILPHLNDDVYTVLSLHFVPEQFTPRSRRRASTLAP